jgi:hypothetical protein
MTTLDPRNPDMLAKAKHVITAARPLAEAGDIYVWHPDKQTQRKLMYDKPSLSMVAGVVHSCAWELYNQGKIQRVVRWGGNWDQDGVILADQSFNDLPHFELI